MNFGYDEEGNRVPSDQSGCGDSTSREYDGTHEVRSTSDDNDNDSSGSAGSGTESNRGSDGSDSVEHERRRHDDDTTSGSSGDFGDDVELVIGEVANQSIDEPLVAGRDVASSTMKSRRDAAGGKFLLEDRLVHPLLIGEVVSKEPSTRDFLDLLRGVPSRQRIVAVAGHLHHGKTSLLSLLLGGRAYRQREDEVERGISVKSSVVTEIVAGAHYEQTSHLMTFVDTPGHPDFAAETAAALRLADAVLFCVDAAESLTSNGARLLRQVVLQEGIPIVLVITKIDRLIMDLKLPPLDAYRKLRMVVDAVNNEISSFGSGCSPFLVSPLNGTVCFASSNIGCFFTTETFALKYSSKYPSVDAIALSQQLWGQVTFEEGRFVRITNFRQKPSFVTLVLEPLYKVVAHSLTGKGSQVLSNKLNPLPRGPISAVREAVQLFCGDPALEGIDALLNVLPATDKRSAWLKTQYRLNVEEEDSAAAIAPIIRSQNNGEENFAVVRVLHGVLKRGVKVVVVDEHSSDAEPFYTFTVKELLLKMLDGFVDVDCAYAGQVVLVTGFDTRAGSHLVMVGGVAATSLLWEEENTIDSARESGASWLDEVRVLPLKCGKPFVHVGVELKNPAKANQLQQSLQILIRTTPGLDAHKEETGEFTISGYGELHLDTALHELRCALCKGVKLGISPPFVSFSETVLEKDGALAVTSSNWAHIGFTAGSLPTKLTEQIENEQINLFPSPGTDSVVKLWTTLRQHDMDALDARNIIATGPHTTKGPSVLINDTLDEEHEEFERLTEQRLQAITAGFRSAVAAGPLIGDVVRGAALRLIFADLEPDARDAAIMAGARTAAKQALLGAHPQLLEPVLKVDIMCPPGSVEKIAEVLQMRRGSIVSEEPIAATTFVCVRALVPAIDSFGLETQLRVVTLGEALPLFAFDSWDTVPGDPFDTTVHIGPLQPARGYQLARDFTLKTRFRKGLPPLLAEFQM
ncbi:U5 small nuclear ribonucleoprotein component,putative [Trypanosoma brucei gambiense DAL972]|uniref:U5 snrnp-specific protein, putative n=1 Tax=Trypanosoma brucei gambiense (strain MHOM/CI/86/DAL972) TaxID=679716 RepID=D0AAB0_TRYB9|nr:U5 small nuclear ribonucleoprotein component,putative [Trypanosoma brucei gambiense DAL972]CBH18611.1 U5 small nuclear ribonucleoprotein component,putative [Trypanosoma brucei gambiense DAL972]|eukprot:XP_011780875.1 U5 small nuclear ribonucleoprotein component,putative [Trypanosoma brucei gambiense DAL972]